MPGFITDLDRNYPDGDIQRGYDIDDDNRDTKGIIQDSFPNIDAAVTVSPDELNRLSGVTSDVQGQIDALFANAVNNDFEVFSTLTPAPTGWTQRIFHNDRYLRVVDNTGDPGNPGDTGGSYTITGLTMPHIHTGVTDTPREGDENVAPGAGSSAKQSHTHHLAVGQPSPNVVESDGSWRLKFLNVSLLKKNAFTLP